MCASVISTILHLGVNSQQLITCLIFSQHRLARYAWPYVMMHHGLDQRSPIQLPTDGAFSFGFFLALLT
ncbi:BgTH12-02885 [Blumeria graminis f. sp. triticale]|uniref:BgTH12-02885 n=1 Tax=Blumeria graminis f. sp. triticale TaxID=1689686 RepID=A0A9W4D3J3_BLUGR|nr:BgTH12-02885 [Blumeria graminis f. sp. triticale]